MLRSDRHEEETGNDLKPGTISGEEVPIVSKTNIKEYRDSFSCEKFTFRSNPNITFYVYVSNFSWPIKIQVNTGFTAI
ncbi:Attractin-like protein 1 [Liparis tanakae]|uniref:Attractin-like protein 1 n=1 Tax=Liparis tanakae TaxID=230148 RepID=A0A4Z2FVM6_9TELE|nr:Attractin-like protein 1 [Liparis tanakae]